MKNYFKSGDIFIWLSGLGLGISLIMITGLVLLIFINASDYFIPQKLIKVDLNDGRSFFGEKLKTEEIPQSSLPDSLKGQHIQRIQLKVGNRDVYGFDFLWITMPEIKGINEHPQGVYIIERQEYGNFYGYISQLKSDSSAILSQEYINIGSLDYYLKQSRDLRGTIRSIEKSDIGSINYKIDNLRLKQKEIEYKNQTEKKDISAEVAAINSQIDVLNNTYNAIQAKSDSLTAIAKKMTLVINAAGGEESELPLMNVVSVYQPNELNFFGKVGFFFSKIYSFIVDDPRESNTEGGVFPALFGTVMLVLLMSIAVVPFGVLAALYLREYAKQGPLVRTVRIAVNNLAGVPSIVFGIFGLGFFIYTVGGTIDKLFYPELLPTPKWGTGGILWASLTLALLTVPVVIVSTEEALASIPRGIREASYAMGATKWQTISRIVLPASTPGILTGLILAMARGAGEVAPLMITGVVKLAPSLPFDMNYPFFHLDRKFMHLGFHIYDVGFQSPNIEAAMPMVYMTTLLLIVIVILLNLTAMSIRARLRKKYKSATF
jgi:phosphate transport system permease protein